MKIVLALILVLLSVAALVVAVMFLASEPGGSSVVAHIGTLLIYVMVALCIAVWLILSRSRSNEVLYELNPDRTYQVRCIVHDEIGYKYILSVIDLVTKAEHIACIHCAYPPIGFWEKKTPQGALILVPEKLEPKPEEKSTWGWCTGGGIHEVI